jgi:signal transduction histidine kinase
MLKPIAKILQAAKKPLIATIAAFCSDIILGFIDYYTGWELGFFVFYFFPILFCAWYTNLTVAAVLSVFSAFVWFLADFSLPQHYSSIAYAFWNSFIRLFAFVLIAYLASKTRILLAHERKVSADLRDAMGQIRSLKGLLPICASCKKIRNDKGYWEQIEGYIRDHSDAEFTHGLCEECARKLYPEAFKDRDAKSS